MEVLHQLDFAYSNTPYATSAPPTREETPTMPAAPTPQTTVDFWFDPTCPYTQLTGLWLVEVEAVRPVRVRWHVMSLAILNEHRDDDPEGDPEGYLWIPARICAAVAHHHGAEALRRFTTALWSPTAAAAADAGTHAGDWLAGFRHALRAADLPPDLAEVGLGTDYDAALRASHTAGVDLLGPHIGTPIIAAPHPTEPDTQVAFFDPIISRVPHGEAAGQLWDGALLVAATPGFHTLKGPAPPADPTGEK